MKIISYQKHIDSIVTRTLLLPADKQGQFVGTELATLDDGLTYVSLPASTTLPPQPKEISASVKAVVLTAARITKIKAASPHVALINERVGEKIREQYSLSDELKLARISIGSLQKTYSPSAAELQDVANYQVTVEAAQAWGRAEKAKLGLK